MGRWLEASSSDRHQYDLDLATGAYNQVVPYFDYCEAPAYGNVDFGVACTLKNSGAFGMSLKLQFNVFNLTNSQSVTAISSGPVNKTLPFELVPA